VIVDLAAESGGNCALTVPGEVVRAHGVSIMGPSNLPATLPHHASLMLSKNIVTLLQHMTKDGAIVADRADEIVKAMVVT
jgi:NAD(P) transhydrogenase subunit alpha